MPRRCLDREVAMRQPRAVGLMPNGHRWPVPARCQVLLGTGLAQSSAVVHLVAGTSKPLAS
eukprot:1352183-Pyramimonas_sp.AAC.1